MKESGRTKSEDSGVSGGERKGRGRVRVRGRSRGRGRGRGKENGRGSLKDEI